jgi:isopenicillin-N epimerase
VGITPRTRLILLSHPVNLTGQFFPVKQICEMAHARGIEVCVDGAQGFAHMDFRRDDLDCDYFGTSLHKWLLAPIGTGMLYIKKDKIGKVWPLVPAPPHMKNRMQKFMHWGTFSPAPFLAISDALAFHNSIGSKRKEERLRYLTSAWVNRLGRLPRVKFLTSFSSREMSCGLATFQLEGVDPGLMQRYLQQEHSIIVQSISSQSFSSRLAPEINGIRVTPNVYTTLAELDRFCDVVEQVALKGIPKTFKQD